MSWIKEIVEEGFSNSCVLVTPGFPGWAGKAFCSLMTQCQSFSEPVFLESKPHNFLSVFTAASTSVTPSPSSPQQMARASLSRVFSFPRVS